LGVTSTNINAACKDEVKMI